MMIMFEIHPAIRIQRVVSGEYGDPASFVSMHDEMSPYRGVRLDLCGSLLLSRPHPDSRDLRRIDLLLLPLSSTVGSSGDECVASGIVFESIDKTAVVRHCDESKESDNSDNPLSTVRLLHCFVHSTPQSSVRRMLVASHPRPRPLLHRHCGNEQPSETPSHIIILLCTFLYIRLTCVLFNAVKRSIQYVESITM